ncbi:MAG: exopolysaccharide biosynthesis polyprenyl glycosylphosphotransferase [Gammaproteobacteria bacterium]|nr:exopolysaccharide biosynthesis polyprenyl glycosylphosphotransferase [Gammaproteobacteria bacterium]
MSNSNTRLFWISVLTLTDAMLLVASFYLNSYWVYGSYKMGSAFGLGVIILISLLSVYLFSGYVIRRQLSFIHIPGNMSIAILFSGVVITAIGYVTQLIQTDIYFWRTQFIFSMLTFGCWLVISRVFLRILIQKVTTEPIWGVIGDKENGEIIAKDFKVIYGEGQFRRFDDLNHVDSAALRGVIILPDMIDDAIAHELIAIRLGGTRVFNVAEFYERFLYKVPLQFLRKVWFATSAEFGLIHHDIVLRAKRVVDIILSVMLLSTLFPMMILVGLVVFAYDRGPAFYSQIRVGVNGELFRVYKFRTMVTDAEKEGGHQWAAKEDNRITSIGRVLRATRLDELPQLWNVLRGDMSFIGPRPERPEFVTELEKAIPFYQYRHVVKPGLTGWAQVMYPYGASQEDSERKLEYDLYYIRHFSLMLDVFIVLKTIRVVLFGRGR